MKSPTLTPLLFALLILAGCGTVQPEVELQHDEFILKGQALDVFFETRLGRHFGYLKNPRHLRGNVKKWESFVRCLPECRIEFELPNNEQDIQSYKKRIGDSVAVILKTPLYYRGATCRLIGYLEE